jgi:Flp pilus assembly protein TadG
MTFTSRHLKERARSESGSIIILTALSMFVVLGIVAFAVDASFLYTERNRMAAAADAAAKAAAIENHKAPGTANLYAFATREVANHGFDPAPSNCTPNGGQTEVCVNRPPLSGPYTSDSHYVEVYVSRPTGTFFSRILAGLWNSVTPLTRAVAGTSAGPNCIVTLNESGNPSLDIGGTVAVNIPGCGVAASGNMHVGNGVGSVTASSIGVQGTCSGCPSGTQTGIAAPDDPLASLAEPANPYGSPTTFVLGNNQPPATLNPGWYDRIDIGNNDNITLTSGLYYVTGPITVGNSATINGSGVTIFLAGTAGTGPCTPAATAGCLDVPNQATVTLSAPTGGAYEGILFFQARSNSLDATFGNTGDYNLSGAMYFPNASVSFGNSGSTTNDCTLFVAQNISIASSGGGGMSFSNACTAYGGSPLMTLSLAE